MKLEKRSEKAKMDLIEELTDAARSSYSFSLDDLSDEDWSEIYRQLVYTAFLQNTPDGLFFTVVWGDSDNEHSHFSLAAEIDSIIAEGEANSENVDQIADGLEAAAMRIRNRPKLKEKTR